MRFFLCIFLFLSAGFIHATENGPLNVKYFQILKYRMGKDSAWQEPPRAYNIHFQGTPKKGYIRMNSHRSFHASWEIQSLANSGPIEFTNALASDHYVTRHDWVLENFEIAMTRLLLKLDHFEVKGDTLRMTGDADILCVQTGSLRQCVAATWINDKDSNEVLVFANGKCTWMNIAGKDTSKIVYDYYAEDDREMQPGNWNLVCDYLELSNLDTMCAYNVIGAGTILWMVSRTDQQNYSFTRLDILQMKKLHATDRDKIVEQCDHIPKLFIGPANRKQALAALIPPENLLAEFEFNNQDSGDAPQTLKAIKANVHALYNDSLRRDIDSTTMEMRRAHFNIAKEDAVWNVSSTFIDQGNRHVAIAVLTLSDEAPGAIAFMVKTQFILLNGKWYMLPTIERHNVSHH